MKPTLIFVPGLVCDATAWQGQVEEFKDAYEILIPNLNSADTPSKMIEAILANAPDKFMLAGHSMGGWIALELMREHADRVEALCVANTTARLDTDDKAETRRKLIALCESNQHQELADILLNAFIFQQDVSDPVMSMIKRNLHALVNQERAMLAREDCVPLLKDISCPTMVICSDHDKVFDRSNSEEIADNIADAQLVTITDSGHMTLMEQKEQFNQALKKWLMR